MAKTIIYLDQNFVSNMAKARFTNDLNRAGRNAEFEALYDHLKGLVDHDKAICPESIFHQLETEQLNHKDGDLLTGIQTVVANLSRGVCFRYPLKTFSFQVFKAARSFLNLPPEERPDWQDAFTANPYARMEDQRLQKRRSWQIEVFPLKPTQYMSDREAEKLSRDSKQTRIEKQKDGVLQLVYGDRIDDLSTGEAAVDLLDYWRREEAPEELLPQFLKSQEIRSCPFIDIHCTLQAALGYDPRRNAREGDALDTSMVATAVPYCEIVATSGDMLALFEQTGLNRRYLAHVFSDRRNGIQELNRFLDDLEKRI
jgi:hypothetical protein